MDIQYIRKLIKLVTDSDIEELEIEESGARVRVTRGRAADETPVSFMPYPQMPMPQHAPPAAPAAPAAPAPAAAPAHAKDDASLYTVVSPIVGTFYRAPAPDADPYVQVGQSIASGAVVGIIEAMKIMNEIESERGGKVVKILVENGQAVEYNQPLVVLDLSA